MNDFLSEPIENLIHDQSCEQFAERCEVLIVGSGYGGSLAAMRLADKGLVRRVYVFERGDEYRPGDFPESLDELPGHVQFLRPDRDLPVGYPEALFDFRAGEQISVLVGNGLGGGSLINANVALEPEEAVFANVAWPRALRYDQVALRDSFEAVKRLLGVKDLNIHKTQYPKFEALRKLAEALGECCHPAPLAITQKDGRSPGGVEQKECIGCGNCITGCNVGAKNTLPMNAIPIAKGRGARFYTGATVLTVEPDGAPDGSQGWHVRFRRTATSKTVLRREVFTMRAQVVILAAGTLGSTEILMRSQARGLTLSERLGAHFSTNGDVIALGYAQRTPVESVAEAPSDRKQAPGPTITGYFKTRKCTDMPRVTIEDGAVPFSLAHVFGEILTTASLAKRNVKDDMPAWFEMPDNRNKDPLAVHEGAIRHSQVLLAMADDKAEWSLELKHAEDGDPNDHDSAPIRVTPTRVARAGKSQKRDMTKEGVFRDIDRLFEKAESKGGFDGGDYLPNPFWKLMPDELTQVSNAPAPGGNLLTVHPLGGCAMGDDVRGGVVNHYGQVFRRGDAHKGDALYHGLYVMDGAIVPCALGVNPFLTIAALAHRNAQHVAETLNSQGDSIEPALHRQRLALDLSGNSNGDGHRSGTAVPAESQVVSALPARTATTRATAPTTGLSQGIGVKAEFIEYMSGHLLLTQVPLWFIKTFNGTREEDIATLKDEHRLVLKAHIYIEDVLQWLRRTDEPLAATVTLYVNKGPACPLQIENLTEMATGNGRVKLLAGDRPRGWRKFFRAACALVTFVVRRWRDLVSGFGSGNFCQAVKGFWRVACNHSNWRYLQYDFHLDTPGGNLTLEGTKVLAYAWWERNPWTALVELPITFNTAEHSVKGLLQVDIVRLTQRSPLQVQAPANTPLTLAAMGSAGMMMLRVMFQTHFWSFGAPDYPAQVPVQNRDPGPVRVENGRLIKPRFITLRVPESQENEAKKIDLRLVRYENNDAPRGSILLVHGLAHGSLVFATDTIDVNLATYLCRNGYDVWMLDYRLSIALPGKLAHRQWTMDQIARYDMAAAVRYVYRETGNRPIQVFAHCIGAGCMSMAVLGGHTMHGDESMISALALHAVYPWVVPSVMNHVKANFAGLFRDNITRKNIDAVLPIQTKVTAADVLLDRIAGSIPWLPGETDPGHGSANGKDIGRSICNRMTLFYSYEWKHGNLTSRTHKALADLVGIANLETFRQIYFIVMRRRLTSRDGENRYVTKENFEQYWRFPTLFAHGRDNEVYSRVSAEAACLRLRALRKQTHAGPKYGVHWYEAPDCGHMDFLFGRHADVNVYRYLDAFFCSAPGGDIPAGLQEPARILEEREPSPDPHWDASKIPACGPIIGKVSRKGNDIVIRLWIEPYRVSAIAPSGMTTRSFPIKCRPLPKDEYYPGTYWAYDVYIPADVEKDLFISVEYPDDSTGLVVTLDAVPRRNASGTDLHDPRTGVRIPLGLPWFQHLKHNEDRNRLAFLVGSCRYPGSPFEEDLADSVYQAMQRHVTDSDFGPGLDHLLLVGDQIYADATADAFDTRELRERFAEQYREAFGARHLRRMLASVPTYMALDDHEFDDNWQGTADDLERQGDPVAQEYMTRFRHGRAAAKAYQWSMSPRTGWGPNQGLWYTFESGGLPFFVMDTRTERTLRQAHVSRKSAQLVGPAQFDALKAWLLDQPKDMPKFIVSGSVLAPVPRSVSRDPSLWRTIEGWAGYPATWRALVEHIVSHRIHNVAFIAGDYHLSAVAALRLTSGADSITAYQIIASGLFAPLPFANERPDTIDWSIAAKLPFSDAVATLEVTPYLLCTKRSHFLRVDLQRDSVGWSVGVAVCDNDGVSAPERQLGAPFKCGPNDIVQWRLSAAGQQAEVPIPT